MNQTYPFYTQFARILNSGQSRSVIISGNIDDLFWNGNEYVHLLTYLVDKTKPAQKIQLVYELNGPIRVSEEDRHKLRDAWVKWKIRMSTSGLSVRTVRQQVLNNTGENLQIDKLQADFDNHLKNSIGNATLALEFLRQICFCSRDVMTQSILIFIEAADMLVPPGKGDISTLSDTIHRRISILQDWFSDPEFVNGKDSVCLLAESASMLHPRVSRLPQVIDIQVPAPSLDERRNYLEHFFFNNPVPEDCWSRSENCARYTAGLSIYALRQLLIASTYSEQPLTVEDVTAKVEEFIKSQVGDDVVEFKKTHHYLKDIIGATSLKEFLKKELIPRFNAKDHSALSGAAVSGPIGGGKTFIFEALAAELDMPILVLKNLRSQWYGQTDVIFERLRRTLDALDKVLIFIDEADTQFGSVDGESHSTEKRLTGKIQQMMSDPRLKGKVIWLLMTARIHRLSPDIRRPGRAGDLIIPVLDPTKDDRRDFIEWVLKSWLPKGSKIMKDAIDLLDKEILAPDYSAASFASLRSHLKAHPMKKTDKEPFKTLTYLVADLIPADIGDTRHYQTLQALLNCTRRSLLPEEVQEMISNDSNSLKALRDKWESEIRELEMKGIS